MKFDCCYQNHSWLPFVLKSFRHNTVSHNIFNANFSSKSWCNKNRLNQSSPSFTRFKSAGCTTKKKHKQPPNFVFFVQATGGFVYSPSSPFVSNSFRNAFRSDSMFSCGTSGVIFYLGEHRSIRSHEKHGNVYVIDSNRWLCQCDDWDGSVSRLVGWWWWWWYQSTKTEWHATHDTQMPKIIGSIENKYG